MTQTSGRMPRDGNAAMTASLPRLASSSSATRARTTRTGAREATSSSAAATIAATPPFMSAAPRPLRRSPSRTGVNGAVIPATPTVSRWPLRMTVGSAGDPGPTATRLGLAPVPSASTTCVAKPDRVEAGP